VPPLISIIHKSPQQPLSPFPACCTFISLSSATSSNTGDSSSSLDQVLSSQPPAQNSLSTEPSSKPLLAYNSTARTTQKTQVVHYCSPTIALLRICRLANGTRLPSRCVATVALHRVPASPLNSKRSIRQYIHVTDRGGRAVCLRLLERWDRGFESDSRHGYLCVRLFCVCVVLCVGSDLATG
jgi:hypothetical protein